MCSSVLEQLPGMCKDLSVIPHTNTAIYVLLVISPWPLSTFSHCQTKLLLYELCQIASLPPKY